MINARKVVIFKGIIDSLDAFAEELSIGFEKEGLDVLMVNVNDLHYFQDKLFDKINEYVSHKDTFVIFMNSVGMLMDDISGGNYWNKSGVKCFDILADPPFFYHNAIESDIENVTFVCVDREQAEYINRYYGVGSDYNKRTGRVRKSICMPLAGVKAQNDDITPYNDRCYDVIFTGSVRDYEDIDIQIDNLDDTLKTMWQVVYQYINEDTSLTIERAIRKCMKDYALDITDEHVHQIILLFSRMDSVIRAKFRQEVIKTVVDSGIKIDVFGDGWDIIKAKWGNPSNLITHNIVSYRESVELMNQSKLALNVMPWFKDGFHDRIATAMLNGCVSITDTSGYIKDNYIDRKEIVIYDLNNLSALPDIIRQLLKNENHNAERIAMAGIDKAVKLDTWHNRAKWFLSL